jgi:signal transduction histidine kinase
MLSAECNGGRQPAALRARDGRLWFPTLNGVVVVDPAAAEFNATPPPVVIEQATLDRAALDVRKPIAVHPGQAQLEIAYAGLSFSKPEYVRFKYRMEGLDQDWVEAGSRRVAYFSHLPAGSYTFRVIAANSDGVWNETGATLAVVVYPPFWQTRSFMALAVLLCLTLATLIFRARIRKLERARTAQEAFARQLLASQEQERKRIATGLHDSLGQQLLVIKNWAMIGLNLAKEDQPSREGLNEISATASQAIEEVREIIYDLRPYQLDKIGLGSTIQFMIEKVAAASNIKFDIALDEIDNLLPYDSEILLYRVVQECVSNILKHSRATAARVAIKRDGRLLHLTVADNGCGFTKEAAAAGDFRRGGLGLSGLSERIRILGGKQTIESSPGGGTRIMITIEAVRE